MDSHRRIRVFVTQLILERDKLQRLTRHLEQETRALQLRIAQLERQAVKDSVRGMDGM